MRAHMRRAEESIVDVEFCLVFPHEALSVPVMRRVLGDTLRRLGADEEGVCDLLLAVTEACTNVLKHGAPGPRYEIVARIGERGCLIQVLNDERGLDSLMVPAPRRPMWDAVHAPARFRRRVAGTGEPADAAPGRAMAAGRAAAHRGPDDRHAARVGPGPGHHAGLRG